MSYTCITCRVVFVDGEVQRAHYKTDWHRYNLKRKVADLPAVTAENFRQRVLNAQQTQVPDKSTQGCEVCGKFFSTQNQLQNHLKSKKHREMEAKSQSKQTGSTGNESENAKAEAAEAKSPQKSKKPRTQSGGSTGVEEGMEEDTDSEVESVESFGDEEGLGLEECLFCSHISGSLMDNVQHMTSMHSFFLPDAEYISDLEGLITYLGQKVGVGHVCLWCNERGKSFHTARAVQQHMTDKGHCKLLHEGDVLLEYTDFYDYRSSYPDYEEGKGNKAEEEGMETDVEPEVLAAEGYQLVLPSGATIGHRSLQKYYKQNINPRSVERTKSVLPKMLAQYKALGWTGATGPTAERRVKDLGAVQRMKSKHYMKMGTKNNSFQFHFRPQVVF